mmetsp:Transcript_86685/g.280649  ORF Transcript_86685/g.280649 Transcript_86685/m.280649 type:complete len:377 (-) Transcript_86685:371-1501(-)
MRQGRGQVPLLGTVEGAGVGVLGLKGAELRLHLAAAEELQRLSLEAVEPLRVRELPEVLGLEVHEALGREAHGVAALLLKEGHDGALLAVQLLAALGLQARDLHAVAELRGQRPARRGRSLRAAEPHQHLAHVPRGVEVLHGVRHLLQAQEVPWVAEGLQLPLLHEALQPLEVRPLQLREVLKQEAAHRALATAPHELRLLALEGVLLGVLRGEAHDHQPATRGRQAPLADLEHLPAYTLEDQVYALRVLSLEHSLHILRLVVNGTLATKALEDRHLGIGATSSDHSVPCKRCKLHCEGPSATCCAGDKHRLATPHLTSLLKANRARKATNEEWDDVGSGRLHGEDGARGRVARGLVLHVCQDVLRKATILQDRHG